jgi:energy-coupling factor transporter ATP-binding protein EcfA2
MHLQRIQVPDFRALKNVDISFEKEFTPRIFPLGSQNGGGKSTLLQLIFVLLHCSGNPDRVKFIQNLLDGFHVNDESGKRTLAIIDIWDGSKNISLDFFVCNESYILKTIQEDYEIHEAESVISSDFSLSQKRLISEKILKLEAEIDGLKKSLREIEKCKNNSERILLSQEIFPSNIIQIVIQELSENQLDYSDQNFLITLMKTVNNKLQEFKLKLDSEYHNSNKLEQLIKKFKYSCKKRDIVQISDYNTINNGFKEGLLLCQLNCVELIDKVFLTELSNKIFMTAHISQIFLFLQPDRRKALFKKRENNQTNYYQQIREANSQLSGFFTYDFLAIDILIDSFREARDKDFKQATEHGGNYGNNYVKLLNELNNLLGNKKINVEPDLSGINFKIDDDETELYPEDLSHGELKRLCIYMWLKYNKIEDAIVLMDELEISFHPDWQYQIVRDLEEWGATNQYILATHSYELCNAVTPAHVKELDPKLQARTIQ